MKHTSPLMSPLRAAAVQMTSTPEKSRNLAQAHELLLEALDRRVDLIAFPENFSLLTEDREQLIREAETLKGPTVATLREWAAEYHVWILGGSVPLKAPPDSRKVTNTSLLISPEGSIAGRYDKIHLFDVEVQGDRPYRESRNVRAGTRVVTPRTPYGKMGLSICYDLRFPELYRKHAERGAMILFIPAAFTSRTGQAHWDILTRTRAVENLSYVVAPGQTGSPYPGRQTHGHTRIIDPWGRILAERPAGTGVVWADLDLEKALQIRREFPALQHRKIF